jgi:hypothetical protein
MSEELARKLSAECAEILEQRFEDDESTVRADYWHPGRSWRVIITTGDMKSIFHDPSRTAEYMVNFHRSHI